MAGHDNLAMNDHYDRRRAGTGVAVDHETWAKIVDVPQKVGGCTKPYHRPKKERDPETADFRTPRGVLPVRTMGATPTLRIL